MPPESTQDRSQVDGYDRMAASRILALIAGPEVFPHGLTLAASDTGRRIAYRLEPLAPAAGSHLTASQLDYLTRFMAPCTPAEVITASHRVSWTDSDGVPNVGYCTARFGPAAPIVAREATLALWRVLADDPRHFEQAGASLSSGQQQTLAATTTDIDPLEILRIGVESAQRAFVQHTWLAEQTPHQDPATFARAMVAGGIFAQVASTWYWELQASTSRRGMVPVAFIPGSDELRYTDASVELLAAMKRNTIATARRVMEQATTVDGLTVREAVIRHYLELDEISKQYALLPDGEWPRCLGLITHDLPTGPVSLLPGVASTFVDAFAQLLDQVTVTAEQPSEARAITDIRERTFHVPDMNCQHCKTTITGVLEGFEVSGIDVDIVTKRIVADFTSIEQREAAFEAIRSGGYTVVPPGGA